MTPKSGSNHSHLSVEATGSFKSLTLPSNLHALLDSLGLRFLIYRDNNSTNFLGWLQGLNVEPQFPCMSLK